MKRENKEQKQKVKKFIQTEEHVYVRKSNYESVYARLKLVDKNEMNEIMTKKN